jgi:hypothetical protein
MNYVVIVSTFGSFIYTCRTAVPHDALVRNAVRRGSLTPERRKPGGLGLLSAVQRGIADADHGSLAVSGIVRQE